MFRLPCPRSRFTDGRGTWTSAAVRRQPASRRRNAGSCMPSMTRRRQWTTRRGVRLATGHGRRRQRCRRPSSATGHPFPTAAVSSPTRSRLVRRPEPPTPTCLPATTTAGDRGRRERVSAGRRMMTCPRMCKRIARRRSRHATVVVVLVVAREDRERKSGLEVRVVGNTGRGKRRLRTGEVRGRRIASWSPRGTRNFLRRNGYVCIDPNAISRNHI